MQLIVSGDSEAAMDIRVEPWPAGLGGETGHHANLSP